jgi:hypothetical protein
MFTEKLSMGATLEAAATATVRELVLAKRPSVAAAFADALLARPETVTAGRLAVAVAAAHRKLPGLAWDEFRDVPTSTWRQHSAVEYLDSGFRRDPAAAMQAARDLVAERAPELVAPAWYEVLRQAYVARDLPLARAAFDLLVQREQQDPGACPNAEIAIGWLRSWLNRKLGAEVPPPPPGTVAFGLIRLPPARLVEDGDLVQHRRLRANPRVARPPRPASEPALSRS